MKKISLLLLALLPVAAGAQGSYPYCQILDRIVTPPWELHGSFVTDADVDEKGGGDFGVVDIRGGGGLGYARTAYGDFDFTANYDFMTFSDDGGIDLPDHLFAAAVNGAYIWRNSEGQAIKTTVSPSIRSDLKEATFRAFYLPFEVLAIQSFTPDISGQAGVAVFPWFEEFLDPRLGIRWAINESLMLDLMYPESKILFNPYEHWDLYAGIRIDRMSEWTIEDNRDSFMMDETRAFIGLNHPVTPDFRVMYQAGVIFGREVDFDEHQNEANLDDAMYISVGLGGML